MKRRTEQCPMIPFLAAYLSGERPVDLVGNVLFYDRMGRTR